MQSGLAPCGRATVTAIPQPAAAQAVAEQLVTVHGAYSPLELLLETNQLDYEGYRAWRRGERPTLDNALQGSVRDARRLVERVHSWARSLDFDAETVALYGIDDNAGTELTASTDSRLDELLHTEFRPSTERKQLDIFLDTGEVAAFNDVVEALSNRDAASAQARLRRLAELNAEHWAIADATTLIESLSVTSPRGRRQAEQHLERMERKWLPSACAVLHARARDLLTPLWRDIGRALEDAPFDPEHPHRHASWAYLNGLDWGNVKRHVENTSHYRSHPTLVGRLAEAEWRLRNHHAAYALWFHLCWQAPAHFEALIANARFPNATLREAWLDAQDEELTPPISPPWFPAWLGIVTPNVVRGFGPCSGDSDGERAFDLLLALAAGDSDRHDIDNRRALQALHPGLFRRYLSEVEATQRP